MPGGSSFSNILVVPPPPDAAMQRARLVTAEHSLNLDDLLDLLQVMGL